MTICYETARIWVKGSQPKKFYNSVCWKSRLHNTGKRESGGYSSPILGGREGGGHDRKKSTTNKGATSGGTTNL